MFALFISIGMLVHTRAPEYDKLLLNILKIGFGIVKFLFETERRLNGLVPSLI